MLDGIKNSDGSTLLDSTAAVWFNEMSDGNAHNLNNLPIIQAGGLNGYFKTGWAVNVDTANTGSATLSNGNSESQCANGTGTVNGLNQSTGTDATIANAPINKYYFNIMNAMGVKGGRQRVPGQGRHRAGHEVRLLRQDRGLRGRLRRQDRRHDSQPRRVHRAQSRLLSALADRRSESP